jgi:hypothetical protein
MLFISHIQLLDDFERLLKIVLGNPNSQLLYEKNLYYLSAN